MEVGLIPGNFVLDGNPTPSPKRGQSPQFLAHVYYGQTGSWIKMKLGTEVGLGRDDIVLDGEPAFPSSKRGQSPPPQFSAHVYCGQTAGWHGGGPWSSHIVLDGPQKGGTAPQFSANLYCGQTAGCIKMPLGMERPQPRRLCVRWVPSPLPKKVVESLNFRPMSVVAKLLNGSRCHLVWR